MVKSFRVKDFEVTVCAFLPNKETGIYANILPAIIFHADADPINPETEIIFTFLFFSLQIKFYGKEKK